jgi:hypothetical protein
MTENGNKPAYPVTLDWDDVQKKVIPTTSKPGLTKREAFAMAAMQGIIAESGGGPPDVAHRAVAMADALLIELEESKITESHDRNKSN